MILFATIVLAATVASETAFLLEKDLIPENIAYDPKTRS